MSVLEGKLVRTIGGTEGRVMAVGRTTYEDDGDIVDGFAALLRLADGKLVTVHLDDAAIIEERPVLTQLPGGGE